VQVKTSGYEIEQFACARARRMFRVTLSLVRANSNEAVLVCHGDATKLKDAKQLAASKHIENLLLTCPEALYLLLNRQDRKQVRRASACQSTRLVRHLF